MVVDRKIVWGGDETLAIRTSIHGVEPGLVVPEMDYVTDPNFARSVLKREGGSTELAKELVLNGLVRSVEGLGSKQDCVDVAQEWSVKVDNLYAQGADIRGVDNPFYPVVQGAIRQLGKIDRSTDDPHTATALRQAHFELRLNLVRNRHQLAELAALTGRPSLFSETVPLLTEVADGDPSGSRYFNVSPRILRNTVKMASFMSPSRNTELQQLEEMMRRATASSKKQHAAVIDGANTLSQNPDLLDPRNRADYMPAVEVIVSTMNRAVDREWSADKAEKILSASRLVLRTAVAPVVVK